LSRMVLSFVLCTGVAFNFAYTATAAEGEIPKLSIEQVLTSPQIFDGVKISVEGEVKKLKYKNNPSGKTYTLFRIYDDDSNYLGVYTKGKIQIKKGMKVRVTGKFKKSKKNFYFHVQKRHKSKDRRKITTTNRD